jgi:hypothetical protein
LSRSLTDTVKRPFSGSYLPTDVEFLLKPVVLAPTSVEEKERRIQAGVSHYSEMISEERRPDARYLSLFETSCRLGVPRLARDIRSLAGQILDLVQQGRLNPEITLCSLVRAGVPYGVLLKRDLARLGADVTHFGVSIIRDRGLDEAAMGEVLTRRPVDGVVFVDGWTGKGAITAELAESWRALTDREPTLAVIADPCGRANLCGSREDWLIPSGILGGNVSGLISRSILRSDVIGPGDYHGCIVLDHLADIDLSRLFVDRVGVALLSLEDRVELDSEASLSAAARFRTEADGTVAAVALQFGVRNRNRIKPGIAEATRAVLRRRPECVLVRSLSEDPDLAALVHLCRQDGVKLIEAPDLIGPYRAITLIRETK